MTEAVCIGTANMELPRSKSTEATYVEAHFKADDKADAKPIGSKYLAKGQPQEE